MTAVQKLAVDGSSSYDKRSEPATVSDGILTAEHKVSQLPVLSKDALLSRIWVPLAQVPTKVCASSLSQA
jgi:hypothetical protein